MLQMKEKRTLILKLNYIVNNLNTCEQDFFIYLDNEDILLSIAKYGFNNTNDKINKMIEFIFTLEYKQQVELTDKLFLYAHCNLGRNDRK